MGRKSSQPKGVAEWQRKLGARIRTARRSAKLAARVIGDACGVTPQAVHHWEVGRYEIPAFAVFKIAQMTDSDLGWLLNGPTGVRASTAVGAAREEMDVPHIGWDGVKDIDRATERATRFVSARVPASARSFALTVRDASNDPALLLGDTCIFDPDVKPLPGKFVLALVGKGREPKIRRYTEAPDHILLKPANGEWKPDKLTDDPATGEIVATMVEFSRAI